MQTGLSTSGNRQRVGVIGWQPPPGPARDRLLSSHPRVPARTGRRGRTPPAARRPWTTRPRRTGHACSGLSTTAVLMVSWMSAPVRAIVRARSVASCSGTMVCRASMCTQELITIAVTALSAAARPNSSCKPGHGLSSSFSAMHTVFFVCYALGGLVKLVRAQAERVDRAEPDGPADRGVGPEARAEHVALAVQREPLAHRQVADQERGGPGGGLPDGPADVPLGDQRLPRGQHHREVLGHGRQASASMMAASRTVSSRFRCGIASSTSPGSRPEKARNSAR